MKFVSVFALALCLAPLGCGGDSSSAGDMSTADLTAASGSTCAQIATCVMSCPSATEATCAQACAAKASTKAQPIYQALFNCAYGICTKPFDAGAAPCTSNTDSSSACISCVGDAATSSTCSTELTACFAN